ncbi:MAG: tripartite tricarboxylate transporter permease [Variovorax sp.]
MSGLAEGFLFLAQPWPFFWLLLGVASGIFVGAVPGLGGGMLISLVMPLTFNMDHTSALVMMVGMYVGSVSGGLISAILLRMPGTPSSVMTTLDGYPMAVNGQPGRALGLGIGSSLIGGLIAGIFLVFLSPPLARWALAFGPWEYFTMALMALVMIASISQGSMLKGLLGGVLGVAMALPGLNESDGQTRLTFGFHALDDGFNLLPVLLGVFVMSQVIQDSIDIERRGSRIRVGREPIMPPAREWRRHSVNLARSSVVGTWIGILPGVGASVSSMVSYGLARTFSKQPQKFGTGHDEGIVASEAANNANVGGALIPLIAMGIPGSPIDAILLGALVMHNIQPGPLLFTSNASFVWALIAAYLAANVLMFVMMAASARRIATVIDFNRAYLLPVIFVFCLVGAFALSNRLFDVWIVIGFGILGFVLQLAKIPLGPFVIGLVLANLLEAQLRSGLQLSDGSYWPMLTRPIAGSFTVLSLICLAYPFIKRPRVSPIES